MKKNIVIFMYNFPPIGAGRGIAWDQFCTNLANDYTVNLITIEPSINDPIYNESKLTNIGDNYNIYRTEPGWLYEKMYSKKCKKSLSSDSFISKEKSYFRGIAKKIYKNVIRFFIFPDRMVFWNKSAESKFDEINKKNKVDLIISVGFPFSTHLLGYKIKRKLGIKWLMDYGDPWSFNPSTETVPFLRRWIDRIVESKIIRFSDHITVTTDTTKLAYQNEFSDLPDISVIKQGVDYEMFRNSEIWKKVDNDGTLQLFYSGIFYKDIRNPEAFFNAISKIDKLAKKVNIILAGNMEDYIIEMVNSLSLPEFINIELIGNISFDQVVNYQRNSDGLLFFGNKGALQVPGKIYEYLVSGTPIFSISYQHDAVSDMINKYNRGETSLNTENGIQSDFERFIENLNSKSIPYCTAELKEFDWSYISKEMNNIVTSIVGDK